MSTAAEAVEQFSTPILAVLGILAIVVPVWVKWLHPRWEKFKRDVTAGRDALVGREAILDPLSGTQLAPALPGVGKRMETIESALIVLADNQAVLINHEERLLALEQATVERIITRAESGAAFSAMEAAFRAHPDDDPDHTIPPTTQEKP